MKTKAIYPGSFDPITYGHLDIIKRASKIADILVVAVLINENKTPLFSIDERIKMIKDLTKDICNVKVVSFEGLLVDFFKEQKADFIIRGIRNANDFDYESQMEMINRKLYPDIEYLYITGSDKFGHISSSLIKELAKFNADISKMLPKNIAKEVKNRINK